MHRGILLKDRYRLEKVVEEESNSNTWVAHDEILSRDVIVKLLRPEVAQTEAARELFQNEMGTMAQLSHPNILATYDTIDDDLAKGAVREKVRGRQLSHFLRARGALKPAEFIATGAHVTDALFAGHEHGIFHQNLRPESVWLCADRIVKVTDFGSVWALDSSGSARRGIYVDPSLKPGEAADESAEVYALGRLLEACLDATRRDAVLLEINEVTLPDDFLAFLAAATSEDRLRRPSLRAAKTELLSALEHLPSVAGAGAGAAGTGWGSADDLGAAAPSRGEGSSPPAWMERRRRVRWWLIGVGLLALGGGIAASILTSGQSSPETLNGQAPTAERVTTVAPAPPVSDTTATGDERPTTDLTEPPDGGENPGTSFGEVARPPSSNTVTSDASPVTDVEERTLDSGAEVAFAYSTTFIPGVSYESIGTEPSLSFDGDLSTFWATPGITAGNPTVQGVGLVLKLQEDQELWIVDIHSPTPGWTGEIYVADAAYPELPDWGQVVDSHTLEKDVVRYQMGGIKANSILLWIPEPRAARTDLIQISEVVIFPANGE